jgi:hypothetical protein
MSLIELPEQNWAYTPTTKTLMQIIGSTVFWTVLYNILMQIPLPKYKYSKDKNGKLVEIPLSEVLDIQNRMVSFIHGSVC